MINRQHHSHLLRIALFFIILLGVLAVTAPHRAQAAVTIHFFDDFANNDAGWTLGPEWEIGPTAVSSGETYGNPDPALDHTGTADNGVAGVVLGGHPPKIRHPFYYLTSPAIDTDVPGNLYFEYYRWLNSDYMPFMQNIIEVYDGNTWVTIWITGAGPGVQDDAWTQQLFDITAYKNANLRVRFGFLTDIPDSVYTVSSWNIDDVKIYSGENEAPTVDDQTFSIEENSPNGTFVGTVIADDPDEDDTLTFAITAGNTGGAFAIDPASGDITVANSSQLDYETTPTFWLTVQVTDSEGLSDTAVITINLIDLFEFPPEIDDQTFSINENSPNGTFVGTIIATDPDVGDTLTFAITDGNPGGAFALGSGSGNITVANSSLLDFEATPVFTFTVQVTDSEGLFDTADITINLIDINEAPTMGDESFSLEENSPNGAFVGTMTATDPDAGDTLTFAITAGNPGGAFAIGSSTGEITVANSAQLDYETIPTFNLTVQVTDSGGLADTATATINLIDVNEAPTVVDQSFSVAENSPNGTSVGTIIATDPDAGDTLTYAITGGNPGGAFALDSNTAEITVADSSLLDFETTPVFTFTVQVTDNDGLFDTAAITVNLTNVNEFAPVVEDQAFSVEENSPNGTYAGTIIASDEDGEDTLTFAITGGNPGGAFALDAGSGDIAVADSSLLDFETTPVFTFTVQVTDSGGLTDTATITIDLIDVNEAPVAVDDTAETDEDTILIVAAPGVLSNDSDPDAGDALSVTAYDAASAQGAIVQVAGDGSYSYDPTEAPALQALPVGDSTVDTFTYTISDNDGLTATATVHVTVTGLNDAPVAADDATSTPENTSVTIFVLLNDVDIDGDPLTVTAVATPANGAASTDGITVVYTPTLGFLGPDVFAYTISDGNGGSDSATITVTVGAVNQPPVAVDDTAETDNDTMLTVPAPGVLANDSDPNPGDTLAVTLFDAVSAQGAAVQVAVNGGYTYDPTGSAALQALAAGQSVVDTFSYTVSDSGGLTDTAVVHVTVYGVGDEPIPQQSQVFLPVVMNAYLAAPDLVVTHIQASGDYVEVVIQNQGNAPVVDAFWVDLYVAPNPAPTHANQLWQDLATEGIVWGVTVPLNPGESLTLIYSTAPGAPNLYYSPAHSLFSGALAAGTPVYAQVDSAHMGTDYGGILESHEITGGPYNNITGPVTAVGN